MRVRPVAFVLAMFVCLVWGSDRMLAQAVSGTIVGTVTDPTGASVAKAQVTIVLTGQDVVHTSVTNESGNFTEPNLPPGTYTVTVGASGFKKEARGEHRAGYEHDDCGWTWRW